MKNIAVIGTGVIGTGWIIRFLANGTKVKAFDKNSQQLHFLKDEITRTNSVSYTHLRAHETRHDLVCRLLLE